MPKDILHPLLIAGPMCKYAKDLRPFLEVLVGPSNAKKMMLDSIPDLTKLKVVFSLVFFFDCGTAVCHSSRLNAEHRDNRQSIINFTILTINIYLYLLYIIIIITVIIYIYTHVKSLVVITSSDRLTEFRRSNHARESPLYCTARERSDRIAW